MIGFFVYILGEERRKQASLKTPIGFLLCKGMNLVKDSNKRFKYSPPNGKVSLKPGKKGISILDYRLGAGVGRGYLGAALGRSGDLKSAPKIKLTICLSSQMARPLIHLWVQLSE